MDGQPGVVHPQSRCEATLWRLRGLHALVTCRIEWLADGVILEFLRAERTLARETWPDVKTAMGRASVIHDALMVLGWAEHNA